MWREQLIKDIHQIERERGRARINELVRETERERVNEWGVGEAER